jgi:hypothetical protein
MGRRAAGLGHCPPAEKRAQDEKQQAFGVDYSRYGSKSKLGSLN